MPQVRLVTPAAPPVRPAPLTASSSARRRRSRSSGCGAGVKSVADSAASQTRPEGPRPPAQQPSQQTHRLKQLAAAMARPAASPTSLRSFNLLRSLLPRRFIELCKVHLSFVIDVPADFLDDGQDDDAIDRPATQWIWQRARDSMKLKRMQNGRPEAVAAQPASTVGDLAVVDRLLTRLASRPGVEQVEGLFRKCGSVARQRRLLDSLLPAAGSEISEDNAADAEAWTAHDLAGALKAGLARLSEPLLTRRLLPYFQQVSRLGVPQPTDCANVDDDFDGDAGLSAVFTARRLKALRLLVQLLPQDRRALLGRLLALLAHVADATDSASRMTPDSLGTVFGPALFYPTPEAGTRDLAAKFNSTLAFVIRHADAVMQVPDSVAQDADGIIRRLRQCRIGDGAGLLPDEAAMPMPCLSVRFAESAEVSTAAAAAAACSPDTSDLVADEFTRSQVAALYAAVQAMPDSAKRRRLIRRFNRTNGGLPTAPTTAAAACSSPSPASSSTMTAASPSISSPVFGRLFDFPMRCLSPDATGR